MSIEAIEQHQNLLQCEPDHSLHIINPCNKQRYVLLQSFFNNARLPGDQYYGGLALNFGGVVWQCVKIRGFCMVDARPKAGRILAFWRTLDWQSVKSRQICSVLPRFGPGAVCMNYGGNSPRQTGSFGTGGNGTLFFRESDGLRSGTTRLWMIAYVHPLLLLRILPFHKRKPLIPIRRNLHLERVRAGLAEVQRGAAGALSLLGRGDHNVVIEVSLELGRRHAYGIKPMHDEAVLKGVVTENAVP